MEILLSPKGHINYGVISKRGHQVQIFWNGRKNSKPTVHFSLTLLKLISNNCGLPENINVKNLEGYRTSVNSFHGNYSFLNLEIVENSNSCHKYQFLTYLINCIFAAETIHGNAVHKIIGHF